MIKVRYLTHPQVHIDPKTPVPLWGLSAEGQARLSNLIESGALQCTTQIISSGEKKAIATAQPIAAALGISLEVREAMHENDRAPTGFLLPDEFEVVASEFFAYPSQSVRGWERAIDAQARIVREVETVLKRNFDGNILFVGHGAVGTLLFCHYSKVPISRIHDQPPGGGNYFTFVKESRLVLHSWRRMEELNSCS